MPTYEFRCPDGTIVEKFFKISEVPQTIPSPKGDGDAVRMITGGAGLVFKGSGFYITDYGKDGKKDQRAAPSTTKSESTSASASSSDVAPAAKADVKPASESTNKSDKPAAPSAPATPPKKD
jgi:predicted nucleic acid-binding Zn ribbon protein